MRYSSCTVLGRLLPIACIVLSGALVGCASLFRDQAQALELEKQWNARSKSDPQTLVWLREHSEWDMMDYDEKRTEVRKALCQEVKALQARLKREAYTSQRYDAIVKAGEPLFTALLQEAKLEEGAKDELPADILHFCKYPHVNETKIVETALADALSSTAQAVCAATTLQEVEAAIRPKAELIREAYLDGLKSSTIDTLQLSTLAAFVPGVDTPAAEAAIIQTRELSPTLRMPFLEQSMNYQALRKVCENMYEREDIRELVEKRLTESRLDFALHAKTEEDAKQILLDRIYGEAPLPMQVFAEFVVKAPQEWSTAKNFFLQKILDENSLQELSQFDSPLCYIIMQYDLSWVSDSNTDSICKLFCRSRLFASVFAEHCKDMNFLLKCFSQFQKNGLASHDTYYAILSARLLVAAQHGEITITEEQRNAIKRVIMDGMRREDKRLYEIVLRDVTDEEVVETLFKRMQIRTQEILAQPQERRRFLLGLYLKPSDDPSDQQYTVTSRAKELIDGDSSCIADINAVLPPTFYANDTVQERLRDIAKWDSNSEASRQWALDSLITACNNKGAEASIETVSFLLNFEANEEMPQALRARVTPFAEEARAMARQRLKEPPKGVLAFGGLYIGMPAVDARLLAPKGVKFGWEDNRITAIEWNADARYETFNEWEDSEFLEAFPETYGLPEFEYKRRDDEGLAKLDTIMSNPFGAAMVNDLMMDPTFTLRFEQERAELYRPFHQIKSRKHKLRFRLKQDGSFQISELK